MNDFPRRGEAWWADVAMHEEPGVQCRMRPWVIVSNDMFNKHSPSVTAVPCTMMKTHMHLPVHVEFDIGEKRNVARCEQVRTFNKSHMTYRICRLPEEAMERIAQALSIQLGL